MLDCPVCDSTDIAMVSEVIEQSALSGLLVHTTTWHCEQCSASLMEVSV